MSVDRLPTFPGESDLIFRPARPEDLDAVYSMGFDVWGNGLVFEDYLTECRNSKKYRQGRWFVMENAELGLCASLTVYELGDRTLGIGSIATRPDLRGRGFASALLTKALSRLDREGASRIFLYSDIAHTFYERFGFQALDRKHQSPPGSVCMVRGTDGDSLIRNPDINPPAYF